MRLGPDDILQEGDIVHYDDHALAVNAHMSKFNISIRVLRAGRGHHLQYVERPDPQPAGPDTGRLMELVTAASEFVDAISAMDYAPRGMKQRAVNWLAKYADLPTDTPAGDNPPPLDHVANASNMAAITEEKHQ
jgi:hypothetical protein